MSIGDRRCVGDRSIRRGRVDRHNLVSIRRCRIGGRSCGIDMCDRSVGWCGFGVGTSGRCVDVSSLRVDERWWRIYECSSVNRQDVGIGDDCSVVQVSGGVDGSCARVGQRIWGV